MSLAHFLLALVLAQPSDEPLVRFDLCDLNGYHVAIRPTREFYVIHCHVAAANCKDRELFVQVRCQDGANGDHRTHVLSKDVPVKHPKESWSFYLVAPGFQEPSQGKITYQLEIGLKDSSQVDERVVMNSFAWRMLQGRIYVGTENDRIAIPIVRRRVEVKGESYKIYSETAHAYAKLGDLRFGLDSSLPIDADGRRSAKRLEPRE